MDTSPTVAVTTTEAPTFSAITQAALSWARHQWATLQAQGTVVPTQLHRLWDLVRDRIRTALDVPSREELAELTARFDELVGRRASDDEDGATTAPRSEEDAAAASVVEITAPSSRTVAEKRRRR